MINKNMAMQLAHGAVLHHVSRKGSDKQPMRVRVSGRCQTWKTRPEEFKLPVKYGLYNSGYITPANAHEWEVA